MIHPHARHSPFALWQAGKTLVVEELNRRGILAEANPAHRSDPDIMILGTDYQPIAQVKVKTKGPKSARIYSWQWDINRAKRDCEALPTSYFILVDLAALPPRYYIVQRNTVARAVIHRHQRLLARHGGQRPKTPDSPHTIIPLSFVQSGEDAWHILPHVKE